MAIIMDNYQQPLNSQELTQQPKLLPQEFPTYPFAKTQTNVSHQGQEMLPNVTDGVSEGINDAAM